MGYANTRKIFINLLIKHFKSPVTVAIVKEKLIYTDYHITGWFLLKYVFLLEF